MMELARPRLRIAAVNVRKKTRLRTGDRFALAPSVPAERKDRPGLLTASLSYPEVLGGLAPSDAVWIHNGVSRARACRCAAGGDACVRSGRSDRA